MKDFNIKWSKIIGFTFLLTIIITLIFLVYPKKKDNLKVDNGSINEVFINNINLMKEAGFEYFKNGNLPLEINQKNKMTLLEMINRNLIKKILDEEGKTCNTEKSYVEVVKTSDTEYTMKVYLSCNNKADYIITTIANNNTNDYDMPYEDTLNEDDYFNSNEQDFIDTENTGENNSNNKPSSNNTKPSNNNSTNNNNPSKPTESTNNNINYVNSCEEKNGCLNTYYTVTYNANGGSIEGQKTITKTVKSGELANSLTPIKNGYSFAGWYFNGTKYDFTKPVISKLTLVANWKEIKEIEESKKYYTVKYVSDGSTIKTEKVEEGKTVSAPNAPTKTGYKFNGWYKNGVVFDFSTKIYQDTTLIANWEKIEESKKYYTVKYISDGTTIKTEKVEEGKNTSKPSTPTKTGYKFLGWYKNNEEFNFSTRIYQDTTLYAKWQIEENEVAFCKIKTKKYYSTGYVSSDTTTTTMNWIIRLDTLLNVKNVKIVSSNHFTDSDYRNALNTTKDMSMVDSNYNLYPDNGKSVKPSSAVAYKASSLKALNFNESISNPYKKDNYWYVNVNNIIFNTNGVEPYFASNLSASIFFIPYTFEIKYTDTNDCIYDVPSNVSKYQGSYEQIN